MPRFVLSSGHLVAASVCVRSDRAAGLPSGGPLRVMSQRWVFYAWLTVCLGGDTPPAFRENGFDSKCPAHLELLALPGNFRIFRGTDILCLLLSFL